MSNFAPIVLHNVSAVIAAQQHNPSVLNEDFLKSNKIIAKSWKATDKVSTPVVSIVNFTNGISISMEPQKLNITQNIEGGFRDKYFVSDIASKVAANLPHVKYSAAGINLRVSIAQDEPDTWIRERFLKSGSWQDGPPRLINAGMRLAFDMGEVVRSITIDAGTARQPTGERVQAIIVNANYHHASAVTAPKIQAAMQKFGQHQRDFIKAVNVLFLDEIK